MRSNRRLSLVEYLLVMLTFLICLAGALLLPVDQCPDEQGRLLLTEWITETGTLPTGNESEVMIPGWGYSYALYPYLSSIISAVFVKAAALFTGSARLLIAASRMCSVFSVTGCCWFCLRLGHRLFEKRSSSILFAVVICFLPQVMFLGMYHNNDSLSLFAVTMMLFFLVEGFERKWPVRCCIGLAVGFSVGLLSYYSIYGWILMCAAFCVLAVLKDPVISDKGRLILKRAGLIAGVCLLLAGWFFIRSAILHDGDFLGIAYEKVSRAQAEEMGYVLFPYRDYRSEGLPVLGFLRFNHYEWILMTAASFVGVFGKMEFPLPIAAYVIYAAFFALGALLCLAACRRPCMRDRLLLLLMLSSVVINVLLHFWQSYARDFQPQGRYVISAIVLLAYMIGYCMDNIALPTPRMNQKGVPRLKPAYALTVVWLALFAWACLGTMTKMLL